MMFSDSLWKKKGLIYKVNNDSSWSLTHSQIPTPFRINNNDLRLYFSTRDQNNRSHLTFIDVDINDPGKIKYINKNKILDLGSPGMFDDSGIMPASLVHDEINDKVYLYYVGWNAGLNISYNLSAGIAESFDQGRSFKKRYSGPVFGRDINNPIFATIPCVKLENGIWRAWYISCTGWELIKNKYEPNYLVRYAESKDGITWTHYKQPCIDYKFKGEAIGRPWVIKEGDKYLMWYSTRGSFNYRDGTGEPYVIGFAESDDGIKWSRKDELAGIGRSEDSSWDSDMICYCSVIKKNDKYLMFYNGNSFGKSGIGYAVRK